MDTATPETYTLSLHDALPISLNVVCCDPAALSPESWVRPFRRLSPDRLKIALKALERLAPPRSEEHTSELQSQSNLVCRLLLEKKNRKVNIRVAVLRIRVGRR